jgi:hypothetical protein
MQLSTLLPPRSIGTKQDCFQENISGGKRRSKKKPPKTSGWLHKGSSAWLWTGARMTPPPKKWASGLINATPLGEWIHHPPKCTHTLASSKLHRCAATPKLVATALTYGHSKEGRPAVLAMNSVPAIHPLQRVGGNSTLSSQTESRRTWVEIRSELKLRKDFQVSNKDPRVGRHAAWEPMLCTQRYIC